jgi:hypothetical protein
MYSEAYLRVGALVLGREEFGKGVFVRVPGFTFVYPFGVEVEFASIEVAGTGFCTYAGVVFTTTVGTAVEVQG